MIQGIPHNAFWAIGTIATGLGSILFPDRNEGWMRVWLVLANGRGGSVAYG